MSKNNEGPPGIDWSQYFVIPQQELHLSDFDNKGFDAQTVEQVELLKNLPEKIE